MMFLNRGKPEQNFEKLGDTVGRGPFELSKKKKKELLNNERDS